MTTAFVLEPQPYRRPSPEMSVVFGVAAAATVLVLFVAGMAFFGLAIAGRVGGAYHLNIRVADTLLAVRLADLWWLFAGLSVASFAAAATVASKAVGFLSHND